MKTLNELVSFLLESVKNPEEIKRDFPDVDDFVLAHHHGYGTWVRNEFKLWHDESKELRLDIWNNMTDDEKKVYDDHWAEYNQSHQGENMHADDASAIILDRLYKKIIEDI